MITIAALIIYDTSLYERAALIFGGTYGLVSLLYGKLNNGGHFNPAITIGVLIQKYRMNVKGII